MIRTRDVLGDLHLQPACETVVGHALAECDAKQRIIEECSKVLAVDGWEYDDAPDLAERTLRLLALPYANRPGYREGWKP